MIDLAAEADPTRGITWSGNGTKHGTDRNDRLNGQHGSNKLYGDGGDDMLWGDAAHDSGGGIGPQPEGLHGRRLRRRHDLRRPRHQHRDGRRRQRLPAGQRRSPTLIGGNGADNIRVAGRSTTVDGGAGDDTITAITASGRARVKCGPGNDTVVVSRFPGNRQRVKVAGDCESARRARSRRRPEP